MLGCLSSVEVFSWFGFWRKRFIFYLYIDGSSKRRGGHSFFHSKNHFFFKLLVAFLKSRLGFVRIAMEKICDTVPDCGFGQVYINSIGAYL